MAPLSGQVGNVLNCSSFKPDYQELRNPCSATILVATDTQFKGVTAYRYQLWQSKRLASNISRIGSQSEG